MKFEWDPEKSELNEAKHGISFAVANAVFDDPLHVSRLDHRFSYFEERWITVGSIESQGIVVVANMFFDEQEEEVIRIISARRATRREAQQYEQ
ncbi:MAG: BrnT family toxin [Spirochaeta sp.]|jgi:uncharacterized DUF497 family protein|nr:BrnT family toxin [Spirochaeta sp.]